MGAHQESTHVTQEQLTTDKNWFLGLAFVMVFALVWASVGESHFKMLFAAVSFILFLRAGINYEMTTRALDSHH